jgi:hypothetical protein
MELEGVLMTLCRIKGLLILIIGINESELGLSMPLGTPIRLPQLSNHLGEDDEQES